jgi:hypothetical protein
LGRGDGLVASCSGLVASRSGLLLLAITLRSLVLLRLGRRLLFLLGLGLHRLLSSFCRAIVGVAMRQKRRAV